MSQFPSTHPPARRPGRWLCDG